MLTGSRQKFNLFENNNFRYLFQRLLMCKFVLRIEVLSSIRMMQADALNGIFYYFIVLSPKLFINFWDFIVVI